MTTEKSFLSKHKIFFVYFIILIAFITYANIFAFMGLTLIPMFTGFLLTLIFLFIPMIIIDRRANKKKTKEYRLSELKKETKDGTKDETVKSQVVEAKEIIKKASAAYKEVKISNLTKETGLNTKEITLLLEDMIYNGEITGEIIQNTLKFEKTKGRETRKFETTDIEILRGGDWRIEGNQSVFYYKAKVKNNSELVITNIQILLTSIPNGLEAQKKIYQIGSLKPGAFESPTLKLVAKESCVGDKVEGIVTYTDPSGTQQVVHIEPFEICYVCNLLVPKSISREEFDSKIETMKEKDITIESDLSVASLEKKIEEIVMNCNFALLQQIQESQSENLMHIEGFAQGLYDKQDVALSIAVEKVEDGSKLVIKAMSDRDEKVTDLLKDFSIKLDDIKSDTELIKEYTAQIEDIMNTQEDLEKFMMKRLGTDFDKMKFAWAQYKEGKLNKKQLVFEGIKVIGKTFVKKMLGKVV